MLDFIWRWKFSILSFVGVTLLYNVSRVLSSQFEVSTFIGMALLAFIVTFIEFTVNGVNYWREKVAE